MLAALGSPFRRGVQLVLQLLGLSAQFMAWAVRPLGWRGPERQELFRRLRQSLLGGVLAALVLGLLIGAGLVFQGISWSGVVGQRGLLANVLVTVLVRELAPVLVALLILGRSGMVMVAELGALRGSGAARVLTLQGVDLLRLYGAPASLAFALAAFTLGVFFVAVALISGGALALALGDQSVALLDSLDGVLRAMQPADTVIFPIKLLVAGGLVGVVAAHTALTAPAGASTAELLPVCFVRAVLSILIASVLMSLAA
ncbi:ABC transporter permease [Sediminicoccus sp. KRV36]|uniref:ABC transporter permease n=1 Tax=Sediminicoccus sp. KRV36 TaxID=3133721 RepID=UPI0020107D17|nr:ABC transporter permease [Sediminicoccus rosea]UPY39099.1 ABC transporter permease [Sediminicoccus rosea]